MGTKAFMIVVSLAAAFLFASLSSRDGMAANMSPAHLDKIQSSRIVELSHCRAFRHCHRRCNRRRCWSVCHRC